MPRLSQRQVQESYNEEVPDFAATSFLSSKFRVPRKDAKGTSAHINFYTAPYYARAAQEILAKDGGKNFKTVSDIFACALHYGLKEIQSDEAIGKTSVWSQLQAWMNICQEAELGEDMALIQEKLRKTVNDLIGDGAYQEARRAVALARHDMEQLPDGYYKERAMDFLNTQFKHLYNGGQNTGMALKGG